MTDDLKELNDFSKREKLGMNMKRDGDHRRFWLMWNVGIHTDLPFDELFESPQLFSDDAVSPGASMLKLSFPMGFGEYNREQDVFEHIAKVLKLDSNEPDFFIPQIYATRQALREELNRLDDLLEKACEALRSPMKVWLYFTARDGVGSTAPSLDGTKDYLEDRSRTLPKYRGKGRYYQHRKVVEELLSRHEPVQVLLHEIGTLFWNAARGYDASVPDLWEENARAEIQSLSELMSTPSVLIESTHSALLYYTRQIRTLRDQVLTVDVKQAGYDLVLHRAAVGLPPPDVKEIVDKYQQSRKRAGDIYAEAARPYIEQATSLAHAYAIVLAAERGKYSDEMVKKFRSKDYKDERTRIRMAWLRDGYLDAGPYSPQKLKTLIQRIIDAIDNGIYPRRSEVG